MPDKKKSNKKEFEVMKSQDFTIKDDSGVFGHLRVKPNAVAWKAKGGRSYMQVTLEQLADFAAEKGKKVQN